MPRRHVMNENIEQRLINIKYTIGTQLIKRKKSFKQEKCYIVHVCDSKVTYFPGGVLQIKIIYLSRSQSKNIDRSLNE